jgi:hypothetical protein
VVETKKQEVSVETQLPELKESIKKKEGIVVKVEFVDNRTQQIPQPEIGGCSLFVVGFILLCLFAYFPVLTTCLSVLAIIILITIFC